MRTVILSTTTALFVILIQTAMLSTACARDKSALDTIEPVSRYFDNLANADIIAPDTGSLEGTAGTIVTWRVCESGDGDYVEYSWVLAKNTGNLMKALIVFDAARAWNTESYIFLPVTMDALRVHEEVGLTVPRTIYDEDGMVRIREIVLSGEAPQGSFVDQFDRFYQD